MTIDWSPFALENIRKLFVNSAREHAILTNVYQLFPFRYPGYGRTDTDKVCIVDIDRQFLLYFPDTLVKIDDASNITGAVRKRQEFEDSYISVRAEGVPLRNKYISAVLYSREALEENDGYATGADWEVVAIRCSPYQDEPMEPITMARNYLQKPGGTYAPYSAQDFAEAVYFWSRHVRLNSNSYVQI